MPLRGTERAVTRHVILRRRPWAPYRRITAIDRGIDEVGAKEPSRWVRRVGPAIPFWRWPV